MNNAKIFLFFRKYVVEIILSVLILQSVVVLTYHTELTQVTSGFNSQKNTDIVVNAAVATSSFAYTFNVDGTLEEAPEMDKSASSYWWVDSGAMMSIENGMGETVQGKLPAFSFWRIIYSKSNSLDTDGGYRPQNIFRLVTRQKWGDADEEAYFRIGNLNMSDSPNRNESNGLLLFSRYLDSDNLYYAGIRVDGHAVIKKKINGQYFTLAEKSVINTSIYDRMNNPILLPKNTWMGLKEEVVNTKNGGAEVKFFMDMTAESSNGSLDQSKKGNWVLVLDAIDDGKSYGGKALTEDSYGGIRTDFMDVEFTDFKITKI